MKKLNERSLTMSIVDRDGMVLAARIVTFFQRTIREAQGIKDEAETIYDRMKEIQGNTSPGTDVMLNVMKSFERIETDMASLRKNTQMWLANFEREMKKGRE